MQFTKQTYINGCKYKQIDRIVITTHIHINIKLTNTIKRLLRNNRITKFINDDVIDHHINDSINIAIIIREDIIDNSISIKI